VAEDTDFTTFLRPTVHLANCKLNGK